jgi:hypothetical protein
MQIKYKSPCGSVLAVTVDENRQRVPEQDDRKSLFFAVSVAQDCWRGNCPDCTETEARMNRNYPVPT